MHQILSAAPLPNPHSSSEMMSASKFHITGRKKVGVRLDKRVRWQAIVAATALSGGKLPRSHAPDVPH